MYAECVFGSRITPRLSVKVLWFSFLLENHIAKVSIRPGS